MDNSVDMSKAQIGPSLPPRARGPILGEVLLRFHYLMWLEPNLLECPCEIQVKWWGQENTDKICAFSCVNHIAFNHEQSSRGL